VNARLGRRRDGGQKPDGQLVGRPGAAAAVRPLNDLQQFGLVQHGRLPREPGLVLVTDAGPGRPGADARAGRVGGPGAVVPGTGQVRVLRRLSGDDPRAGPPLFRVEQPERHAAVVMVVVMVMVAVLPPRVGTGRAVVLAGRHGRRAFVLLLLDLGYLVRVPVAAHVLPAGLRLAAHAGREPAELDREPLVQRLVRLDGLVVQQLDVAAARRVRVVVPGRPVDQAVGVGGRLPVAEVGAVPATADAPGDARLLDRLADHHAVLLELLGEYGVQERVAARVQRQHEHGEHLGLFQGHEPHPADGGQRDERDRRPAQQVGEHEQRHALGDPRVVRVPRLRAADGAVHLQVAAHQYEERHAVDEHQEHHVHQAPRAGGRLERETRGELAVVGHAEQRQGGHRAGERPAAQHDVRRVLQREPLVQVHRVRDGVVPLQSDHRQRVHGQLGTEHGQHAGQLAARGHLPRNRVHLELAERAGVHDGQYACEPKTNDHR